MTLSNQKIEEFFFFEWEDFAALSPLFSLPLSPYYPMALISVICRKVHQELRYPSNFETQGRRDCFVIQRVHGLKFSSDHPAGQKKIWQIKIRGIVPSYLGVKLFCYLELYSNISIAKMLSTLITG